MRCLSCTDGPRQQQVLIQASRLATTEPIPGLKLSATVRRFFSRQRHRPGRSPAVTPKCPFSDKWTRKYHEPLKSHQAVFLVARVLAAMECVGYTVAGRYLGGGVARQEPPFL
jgi:hypothetical protein